MIVFSRLQALRRFGLVVLFATVPLAASAADRCTDQAQAEVDRVTREFSAKRPAQGDQQAERAWSSELHTALAAIGKRADACASAQRSNPPPEAAQKQQACVAASHSRLEALQKKYAGRPMTPQEQATRRDEENQLVEDRMACMRR
jgi:hypothetical protein